MYHCDQIQDSPAEPLNILTTVRRQAVIEQLYCTEIIQDAYPSDNRG